MKISSKILSAVCLCALATSLAGCSNGESSSEPASTTSQIFVQKDEYEYGDNSEESPDDSKTDSSTTSDTSSSASGEQGGETAGADKPHTIAENEVTSFNLPVDMAYNTSLKPNITDDISFQVELIYTEDFYKYDSKPDTTEILPFTETTTYADICNLSNFNLVTMEGDMSYAIDNNGRFDYYGIMHTIAIAPTTYTTGNHEYPVNPTMNLELVGADNQIITDASQLVSTNGDIRVKAISAKATKFNQDTDSQKSCTPIMLGFNITAPDHETRTFMVGMDFMTVWSDLCDDEIVPRKWTDELNRDSFYIKDTHNNEYLVLKNSDYTIVFVKGGNKVDSISLIKN